MTTIVLDQPGQFSIHPDTAPAAPGIGEALVRVHRVGVCGTDLHAYRGKQPFFSYPRIIGHEVGVEVVALGAGVTGIAVGDRCAIEPYLECGTCIACRRGTPNCCVNLKVLGVHTDGAMRSHLVLPARKLHVSRTLSYDQLALVETLGIGAHAVARAGITAADVVLVIGVGPIGCAAIQFVQAAGATVVVMDMNEQRLAFARAQFGVESTLTPGATPADTAAALPALCNGDLPTVVIDATGNPQSMQSAFLLPCHGGKLVFVGLFPGDVTFHDPNFHRRELTLFASRNATAADFARIIAMLEAGRLDTRPWITHTATAAELPSLLPGWLDPASGCLKAMVSFS